MPALVRLVKLSGLCFISKFDTNAIETAIYGFVNIFEKDHIVLAGLSRSLFEICVEK